MFAVIWWFVSRKGRRYMLGLIVSIIVIGLPAGALARLIGPSRQDISFVMTIVLGIVGSFVGLLVWISIGKPRSVRR